MCIVYRNNHLCEERKAFDLFLEILTQKTLVVPNPHASLLVQGKGVRPAFLQDSLLSSSVPHKGPLAPEIEVSLKKTYVRVNSKR